MRSAGLGTEKVGHLVNVVVDGAGGAVELPGADASAGYGDALASPIEFEQQFAVWVVDGPVTGGVVALNAGVLVGQQPDVVGR